MYHLGPHGSSMMSLVPLYPPALALLFPGWFAYSRSPAIWRRAIVVYLMAALQKEGGKEIPASKTALEELSQKPISWFQFTSHWPPHPQERLGKWAEFWFGLFWILPWVRCFLQHSRSFDWRRCGKPGDLVGSWWFLSQWLNSFKILRSLTLRHGNICCNVTRFHL